MAAVNYRRVLIGALAGGVVWSVWSIVVEAGLIGMARYNAAIQVGHILSQPRYSYFTVIWFLTLFVLALVVAWLYAAARATLGPGPKTAFKLGFAVGFAAGFPTNFSNAAWFPLSPFFPHYHMVELWVGAILATLVAGWLYRE